jgi:sodium transport system ATP-binding protein
VIELSEVHKAFGAVRALAGVSFTADDGRITGLLGPNGAGKTTALRVVYGLLAPDRGRAAVDGIDLAASREAAQRRLGVLPHALGL